MNAQTNCWDVRNMTEKIDDSRIEITGKIDASRIDVLVIPRILLPVSAVNGVVEMASDVFGSASASYILDNNKCERSALINNEYRQIFEKIKRKYKKKNFIYITEMPFFIVLHRVEVADTLWFLMITSTTKHVEEGVYESYEKERKQSGGIITIPHDMKKMKKRIDKARGVR